MEDKRLFFTCMFKIVRTTGHRKQLKAHKILQMIENWLTDQLPDESLHYTYYDATKMQTNTC